MTHDQETMTPPTPPHTGLAHSVVRFLAGWIAPCFNPFFYAEAVRRNRLRGPLTFFVVFALAVTALQGTLFMLAALQAVGVAGQTVAALFAQGVLPSITIQDGVAKLDGPLALDLDSNPPVFLGVDVAGTEARINKQRYVHGVLIGPVQSEVMVARISLMVSHRDVQTFFGLNPLVLDATTITQHMAYAATWAMGAVVVGLVVVNMLLPLVYVAVVSAAVGSVLGALRTGLGGKSVLLVGLYAVVPATYASGIFPVTWTWLLVHTGVWVVALVAVAWLGRRGDAARPPSQTLST